MSESRRRDAATATLGYGGLVASGAMRHSALERAYAGGPRPKFLQESKFVPERVLPRKHLPRLLNPGKATSLGRGRYLAGAGLAIPAGTAAAYSTNRLLTPAREPRKRRVTASKADQKRRSFLAEGIQGTKDAMLRRQETMAERPPVKLVAGNYLLGAAVGAGTGGLTHLGLSRARHVPGSLRAGLATAAGTAVGSATLPLQSKLVQHASRGRYKATASGIQKVPDKRRQARTTELAKMSPRDAPAVLGAHWTTRLSQAADRIEPYEARRARHHPHPVVQRHLPNADRLTRKLVKTGRTKAAETVRAASYDVSSLNDKDQLIRQVATGQGRIAKREDIGAGMTRGQRRARVTAAGALPVLGDFTQAATAARLSPDKYRKRTAVQNYLGGTAGQAAGAAAGTGGALYAAHRSPAFQRQATSASEGIDRLENKARGAVGMKPKGPSLVSRVVAHPRTPAPVRRLGARAAASPIGRAVAKNPKVAAIGALVGGALGGMAGQQLTYGHIMNRDDRWRRSQNSSARGTSKVAKLEEAKPLTRREKKTLASRKEHSAFLSSAGGTIGLTALGATLASSKHSPLKAAHRTRIGKLPVPLLTTGAGLGGVNALLGARIQRKEAQQTVAKAFGLRATGLHPRVPGMRKGFIRQTRYPSGLTRVSSVRGGLS